MRFSRTTTVLAAAAILATTGAGAYAAGQITTSDIKNHTIQIRDIKLGGLGYRNLSDYAKDKIEGPKPLMGYEVRSYDYTQVSGGGIATMSCPDGKQALGGGYWFKDDSAMTDGLSVIRSMPGRMDWDTNEPKKDDYSGWIIQPNKPANINPGTLTVYVECANVSPEQPAAAGQ
jgi:hypothetical protein